MEYQRFVAYVYEYRKGKKENNCGFLRVENRNENVSVEIHLKCIGLPQNEKCNIYGFKRAAEMIEGVFLGNAYSEREKLDCVIESINDKDSSWGKEFTEFGGIVILAEHGAFFGTEWDDQMIKPQNFKEREEISVENLQEKQEAEMMSKEESTKEESTKEESTKEESTKEESTKEESAKEQIEKQETDISEQEADALEQTINNVEKTINNVEQTKNNLEREINVLEQKTNKVEEEKIAKFCPFYDDEISECQRIHPNEFFRFCPTACALRNNRFLNHGIYNFGHLLMGTRADGKRILGVPGRFDQQEQFMANMFGFPFFKESRDIQVQGGRGGYWYRLINSANFH